MTVTSTGSRDGAWTLSYDDSMLPTGWTFAPINQADLALNLERDSPQIVQLNSMFHKMLLAQMMLKFQ